MRKGNAFDLLADHPEDGVVPSSATPAKGKPKVPSTPLAASPEGKQKTKKSGRYPLYGIACGVIDQRTGELHLLLHRKEAAKSWALAYCVPVLDAGTAAPQDVALAKLLAHQPSLPALTMLSGDPVEEKSGEVWNIYYAAILPPAILSHRGLTFRPEAAAVNLFPQEHQARTLSALIKLLKSAIPPPAASPPSAPPVPTVIPQFVPKPTTPTPAPTLAAAPIPQRMIVVCGLPGSGKSTFSNKVLTSYSGWARVNQDDLGSRQMCEAAVEMALESGLSVLVDRCNFDRKQRKTWLQIAAKYRVPQVDAVFFDVPPAECLRRVRERPDHPTLGAGTDAAPVIADFAKSFVAPSKDEGFSRVIVFRPEDELVLLVQAVNQ